MINISRMDESSKGIEEIIFIILNKLYEFFP